MTRRAFALSVAIAMVAVTLGSAEARHFPPTSPAILTGGAVERVVDTDGDKLHDDLVLDVPVRVSTAGTYTVTGRLEWPEGSGGEITATAALNPGDRFIQLRFPGSFLWNRQRDDPYNINVTLSSAATGALLDWYDFRTSAYKASSFEPSVLGFPRAPVLYPADTDRDGTADTLHLDVLLYQRAQGKYLLNVSVRETTGGRYLAGLPDLDVSGAMGGRIVTVPIPKSSLRFDHAGTYTVDVALFDVAQAGKKIPLDATSVVSERFRMAAFAAGAAPRFSGVNAPAPRDEGGVVSSGLLVKGTLADAGRFEFYATLADPAVRRSAFATTDAVRYPTAGMTAQVHFRSPAISPILNASESPVIYHFLRDEGGLVVAGGRVTLPPAPRVTVTAEPESALSGENVTFTATAGGLHVTDVGRYAWDRGNGFLPGETRMTTTFDKPGLQKASVRVTNNYGISREATAYVNVTIDYPPDIPQDAVWVATEREVSNFTVPARDPNGRAMTVRILEGPDGVTASGMTLSWNPPYDAPSTAFVRIAVSDGAQETTFNLPVVVNNVDSPPMVRMAGGLTFTRNHTATAGVPFSVAFEGYDLDRQHVTLTIDRLPPEGTFVGGALIWTRPVEGEHEFTLTATTDTLTSQTTFRVTVVPPVTEDPAAGGLPAAEERKGIPGPGFAALLAGAGLAALLAARRQRRS